MPLSFEKYLCFRTSGINSVTVWASLSQASVLIPCVLLTLPSTLLLTLDISGVTKTSPYRLILNIPLIF